MERCGHKSRKMEEARKGIPEMGKGRNVFSPRTSKEPCPSLHLGFGPPTL